MGLFQEFKEFAMKGNVVDLAVGVVIGAAFGKITTSLVNDILMPPLGFLIGHVDFKDLKLVLKSPFESAAAPVTINYGNFINEVVNFIIVAFALFMVIKFMNRLQKIRKKEEAAGGAPSLSLQEELLTQIRDSLKAK